MKKKVVQSEVSHRTAPRSPQSHPWKLAASSTPPCSAEGCKEEEKGKEEREISGWAAQKC